eukprot:CAMPEP_0118929802 /NCGR_PEP_ID=MMETSP1169-20130426/6696_1 /TAXON_ID=36882 /ORGANISM="Pyramimonas obovata, Strain CCMP722" /LENGTH=306 /DNA_ID=CAMNT_0006872057 /DNA_START=330 /DNA_END=1251 /DNA_ORIENTATION=-
MFNKDMHHQRDESWPGCPVMAADHNFIEAWLEYWSDRQKTALNGNTDLLQSWHRDVFSRHVFFNTSTNQIINTVPIEPLVGLLRHPLALCFPTRGDHVLNKDYMIAYFRDEWENSTCNVDPKGRNFFFDLGASTYLTGGGGASLSWFIDEYRNRGIQFDRVIAWEAKVQPPLQIFADFPNEVLARLSYFNVPVSPREGDPHHPLSMLRLLCRQQDFVVLKIDIDMPTIEEALVGQILADHSLSALIDEIYFEHHVTGTPMTRFWGAEVGANIVESYNVFTSLRKLVYALTVGFDASYAIQIREALV